jgi:DNA polymerase elongation subunit (family B)
MKYLVIDIETEPQPQDQAMRFAPEFTAPSNYKDSDKIKAYIESARSDWLENCALDAMTGQVLAVGCADETGKIETFDIAQYTERELVERTLGSIDHCLLQGGKLIGYNVRHFDLPFLCRRAYVHGVRVPLILAETVQNRYSRTVIDLMEVWLCGDRNFKGQSLDNVAKACGVGEKTGSGADFSRLFSVDKFAALAYLRNDIELTVKLAKRFGVIV